VKIDNPILRATAAVLVAVVVSFVLFIVVGLVLPVVLMKLSFGTQPLLDAPGHGSALLLITAPIAGVICFVFTFGFIVYFYQKFTQ
jgi:hypothetical protein